ncbi:MAG: hypothetical protein U1E28_19150 [Beijerinckiaceae bacterium]
MKYLTRTLLGLGFAAGLACVAAPASAAPRAASPQLVAGSAAPAIEKVVYRRAYGYRPVARAYGYRGWGYRPYAYRPGWGAPALGLGLAAGIVGAAAAAATAPGYWGGYPAYGYYPAPACYIANQPLYDAWGNVAAWQRVRVCQ